MKKNVLSILLYVFSGVTAALGIFLLVVLLNSAQAVPGYEIFFQMAGLQELAGLFLNPLRSGLINLSIVVFLLMLAIAATLFAGGRMASRQIALAERVRILEEKLGGVGKKEA